MDLNTTKLALTIPMILLLGMGVLATGSKAWAWGDDGGGGFHYWHHFWFHHWGCSYGCEDFNGYQPDDNNNGPSTSSNQGTSVNIINSPGAEVNTYQSASSIIQPIVHGLCQLTQVNCNPQPYGDQGP